MTKLYNINQASVVPLNKNNNMDIPVEQKSILAINTTKKVFVRISLTLLVAVVGLVVTLTVMLLHNHHILPYLSKILANIIHNPFGLMLTISATIIVIVLIVIMVTIGLCISSTLKSTNTVESDNALLTKSMEDECDEFDEDNIFLRKSNIDDMESRILFPCNLINAKTTKPIIHLDTDTVFIISLETVDHMMLVDKSNEKYETVKPLFSLVVMLLTANDQELNQSDLFTAIQQVGIVDETGKTQNEILVAYRALFRQYFIFSYNKNKIFHPQEFIAQIKSNIIDKYQDKLVEEQKELLINIANNLLMLLMVFSDLMPDLYIAHSSNNATNELFKANLAHAAVLQVSH